MKKNLEYILGVCLDERHEIYLAVRTDLPEYKDHVKKCKEIIEKYSFKR